MIKENLDILFIVLVIILEIGLRFIPTYKNYSIIDFIRNTMLKIHAIIDLVIPNIRNERN